MKATGGDFEIRPGRAGTGLGLFAARDFPQGAFVIEYTGEKISTALADTLSTRYLFEIDEKWTIDAEQESNTARYINHACMPNAEARIEGDRIMIYAIRDIHESEEITIDYGDEYFDEFIKPVGCRCGADKHRA